MGFWRYWSPALGQHAIHSRSKLDSHGILELTSQDGHALRSGARESLGCSEVILIYVSQGLVSIYSAVDLQQAAEQPSDCASLGGG